MGYEAYVKMVVEASNHRDKYITDNWVPANPVIVTLKIVLLLAFLTWGLWAWTVTDFSSFTYEFLAFFTVSGLMVILARQLFHDNQTCNLQFNFEAEYPEDAKIIALDKKYRTLYQ